MSILLDKTVTPVGSVFQTEPSSDFTGITTSGSLIDSVLIKGAQNLTESEKNQVKENLGIVDVPDNDTKNTAGATDNSEQRLYLIGATEQTENPQTYSHDSAYVEDGCLYSDNSKVLVYERPLEYELQSVNGIASTHAIPYKLVFGTNLIVTSGPFGIYDMKQNSHNYIDLRIRPYRGYTTNSHTISINPGYSQNIKIYLDLESTVNTEQLTVSTVDQISVNEIIYNIKTVNIFNGETNQFSGEGYLYRGEALYSILDIDFVVNTDSDWAILSCTQTVYLY